ncbi:Hemin transport system permease protein HmuU [compost metagenome]
MGVLALLLVVVAFLAIRWGAVDLPTRQFIDLIMGHGAASTEAAILWEIRFPRVLLALVAGIGLAAAGVTWQGVLRNPLADPYLIGVSAGGALGAGLALFWKGDLPLGTQTIPVAAFLGSLMALALVWSISGRGVRFSVERMLLAGVAVGSFLSAILSMLVFWNQESLTTLYFWMLGSFSGRTWEDLTLALPYLGVGLVLVFWQLRHLNVLQLGSERARGLGVDTASVQRWLIIGASLVTASVVAVCGMIGFVGLVVPHLTRLLVGPDLRKVLPASCLLGAILLVGADLAARTLWAPAEMPVGVLTALLGAPFFLYLIARERRA